MNTALSTVNDSLSDAYAKLGLSVDSRPQLISNANDALRVIRGAERVTAEEIDATVERLAQSEYVKLENRNGTIAELLQRWGFSLEVYRILTDLDERLKENRDFFDCCDIRNSLSLMEKAAAATQTLITEGNLWSNWKTITSDQQFETLRELALVSAVCREMSGFDPQAEIKFAFRRNELDFEPFAEAIRNDRNLLRLTTQFMQKL